MPGITRTSSGPNGPWNFIPDNGNITLTRDLNNRIVLIQIDAPDGRQFQKTLTRDGAGRVTNAAFWIQTI